MHHRPKFHQNRSNGWRYIDLTVFFKWRPSAILDLLAPIGTTLDDHLVVSIVVQNLVEIDEVVSIT